MTTGSPLYLVSACGSAEEFVAAFRRYADRTGLFVPSAAPLPAGRRGRLAITLKDGGVMIEGEAEILQSSAKPTVLHGRPGMTVKFVEPDEPSKIVIGELEKARLALRPAPPSVAPRPAEIPAAPRPVVPTPGGRIDAANALAECVVIGDPSTLREIASAPRGAGDGKFVVPAIPAIGAPRPKTPSTSPEPPKPPATNPEPAGAKPLATNAGSAAAKPPTTNAAPPAAKPPTAGSAKPAGPRMTSIGFPALDKLPAAPASGRVATTPATGKPDAGPIPSSGSGDAVATSSASSGSGAVAERTVTAAAAPTTPKGPAQPPSLETRSGEQPTRADATPPRFSVDAKAPARTERSGPPALDAHEAPTKVGPSVAAKSIFEPVVDDEATSIAVAPLARPTAPAPPAVSTSTTPDPSTSPRSEVAKNPKATSIGFPALRTPFQTQPLGVVPPASAAASASPPDVPGEPAPPALAGARPQQPPRARGKNPTTPPLTPRHPTPVAPVPIVRLPGKPASVPATDEERTDLSGVPPTPEAPPEVPTTEDTGSTPEPASTQRSGGMRASEILAAIPAGDWTMAPDESVPHALPPDAKIAPPATADASDASEPTPAPAEPPKGPPTGDWTISLDPEKGWSEPEKLAKSAPVPPATAPLPKSGNPVLAVASDRPIEVVQWEDKPTSVGESKIEIDATLMEPLQAMPAVDDAAASDSMPAPRLSAAALPPPPTMPPPIAGLAAGPPAPYPMPSAPPPPAPYPMPSAPAPSPMPAMDPSSFGAPPAVPAHDPARRKKLLLMAIAACAIAIGAIVVLVLALGKTKATAQPTAGSGRGSDHAGSERAGSERPTPPRQSAAAAVAQPVAPGSESAGIGAEPAGSGETKPAPAVAQEPPADAASLPPSARTCSIAITSSPSGAEVVLDGKTLGTTPSTIDLPCGAPAKLMLRKKPFPNTVKAFTPAAGKPNKLAIKLARPMFSVKVTSTPMGATVKVGGRSLGVTPTTIKLPGFDTTTITLTKPGFAPASERVTPKSNNTSQHVTLKKGKGR